MKYVIISIVVIIFAGCNSPQSGSPGGTTTESGQSLKPPVYVAGQGTYDEKLAFPFNDPRAREGDDVARIKSKFLSLIDLRRNKMPTKLFDMTYYYIGPYGFANRGRRIGPSAFEGQWLKFADDFTYEYGVYDEVKGSGVYHYSDTDFFLMMYDSDPKIEPRLFSIQSNSEFFNFIGRPIIVVDDGSGEHILLDKWSNDRFLNQVRIVHNLSNGMQIMMKMLDEKPQKPSS